MRIGVVAPACPLDRATGEALLALVAAEYPGVTIDVHPQCFLEDGHFAGSDAQRAAALLEFGNDAAYDAIWFARGGYGANRIAAHVLAQLGAAARDKLWLGYSDMGFLLAGLYAQRIGQPVHAPMPADLRRAGGEAAVRRSLDFLTNPRPAPGATPRVAFNLTVLASLTGTPLQPDLAGHELWVEEVDEYHYRIDRALWQVVSAYPDLAGLRLGRCAPIPENDRAFGSDEDAIARHWCDMAGIAYLGRADIGHDINNQVLRFG